MDENKDTILVDKDEILPVFNMKENEKKLSFSKLICVVTFLLFALTLLMIFVFKVDTVIDASVYVAAITVTGSIFGSNLCWYSKKASAENQYKLRMSMFIDSARVRLYYNEEMMKKKKIYGMNDEDIIDIDNSGDMDEMMNESISHVKDKLDSDLDSCSTENELQQFN